MSENPIDAHNRILKQSDELKGKLDLNVQETQKQNILRYALHPEETAEDIRHAFGEGLLQGVQDVQAHYATRLEAAQNALPKDDNALLRELEHIHEALLEPVTVDVTDNSNKGRYVMHNRRGKNEDGDTVFTYGIDFLKVKKDLATVQTLKNAYPQHAAELQVYENALLEMKMQDRRHGLFDREEANRNNYADQKLLQMAKITAFLAASTAALLTGVVALVNKKSMTAPLLYGAVAVLIGSPKLRKSLFGGASDVMASEVDATLNNPAFKELSKKYDIRDAAWSNYVEEICTSPTSTKTILRTYERNGNQLKGIESQVEEYAAKVFPSNDQARANLIRMFADGAFASFARMMLGAKNKDARDVIQDYIKLNAVQYA